MEINELVEAIQRRDSDPLPFEIVSQTVILFDNIVLSLQHIAQSIQEKTKTKANVGLNVEKTEARARVGRYQFFLQRFKVVAQRRESGGPLVGNLRLYSEYSKWAILIFEAFVHQNGVVEITSNIGPMRTKVDNQKEIELGITAVIHSAVLGGRTYWSDRENIQKLSIEQLHSPSSESTTFLGPEDLVP